MKKNEKFKSAILKITDFLSKYTAFQLLYFIAAIAIIIGLIISISVFISQKNQQKQAEAAIYAASDDCVEICAVIYEEMDNSDDPTYLAHKSNVENAETAVDKYYTTLSLINYTFEVFRKFKDKSAAEYQSGAPNDYKADLYQKKLNELQDEFLDKQVELENAKASYSLLSSNDD